MSKNRGVVVTCLVTIFIIALFLAGAFQVYLRVSDKVKNHFMAITLKLDSIQSAILSKSTSDCELFSQGMGLCNSIKASENISRTDFIRLINSEEGALEIGPFFNPSLDSKVKYFDVLNKEGLLEKARKEGLDTSRIPYIDYVNAEGDLSIIKEKFNSVISSHNIEHQIDLIRHLQQVESLLSPRGEFFLAIPDKRFCFDHFIPETALSEVVAVHYSGVKAHSLQTILSMRCETAHNDSVRHWNNDHGFIYGKETQDCYSAAFKEFQNAKGDYIDSHKWRFTPENFQFIIKKLHNMGFIKLKIKNLYYTAWGSNEFYAILYKD